MKMAIIADVHSNLQALTSIVDSIQRERVDLTVCAGDVVGYGGNPNECAHTVAKAAKVAVMGNHDWAAVSKDTTGMNPYAAAAARWTSESADAEAKEYLGSLKVVVSFQIADSMVAMSHGSIGNYIEYVYEEDVDANLLESVHADLVILGHTHIPYEKRVGKGMVVNPGSVGQPRDGDPRASFAVYDSESRTCRIRRIDYDIEGAARAVTDSGLPRMLAERLFLGR